MRILALKTSGLVLPSIHASMVRAFQSLGIEILDLPIPNGLAELQSLQSLARQGYQAIFSIDLGGDHKFISCLKDLQRSIRIPWIIWFVDDPEGYGFPAACAPEWTMAFCWDREISKRMSFDPSGKGIPVFHLPLAADPEIFFSEKIESAPLFPGGVFVGSTCRANGLLREVARTTPGFFEDLEVLWGFYRKDLKRSPQELAWMGIREKTGQKLGLMQADPLCRLWVQAAVHMLGKRKRSDLVSRLIGPRGGVFGNSDWRAIVGEIYQGPVSYGGDLRKVYNGSAFVLDTRQPQARTGLTQRIFDAGACGRPVLAEYSPEIDLLFEPGDEILSFHSLEHALELKNESLGWGVEANKGAAKIRERVLSRHTYRHRASQILQALKDR